MQCTIQRFQVQIVLSASQSDNRLPSQGWGKEKTGRKENKGGGMGEKMRGCTMAAKRMASRNITTHKMRAIKVFLMTFVLQNLLAVIHFLGTS